MIPENRNRRWMLLALAALPIACASAPVTHPTSSLGLRQIQSRTYSDTDAEGVLKSTLATFQDEGFSVRSADVRLGFVAAAREHLRPASRGLKAARWTAAALTYGLALLLPSPKDLVGRRSRHRPRFPIRARGPGPRRRRRAERFGPETMDRLGGEPLHVHRGVLARSEPELRFFFVGRPSADRPDHAGSPVERRDQGRLHLLRQDLSGRREHGPRQPPPRHRPERRPAPLRGPPRKIFSPVLGLSGLLPYRQRLDRPAFQLEQRLYYGRVRVEPAGPAERRALKRSKVWLIPVLAALAAGPAAGQTAPGRYYDVDKEVRFEGTVREIVLEPRYKGAAPFLVLRVEESGQKAMVTVEISPSWFFGEDIHGGEKVKGIGSLSEGPDGTRTITSAAFTVGQVLIEAGYTISAGDRVDPPIETPVLSGAEAPLVAGLTVTYQPGASLTITADGIQVQTRSAAATVGQALAEGLVLEDPVAHQPVDQAVGFNLGIQGLHSQQDQEAGADLTHGGAVHLDTAMRDALQESNQEPNTNLWD